jgi:hypothetical protein
MAYLHLRTTDSWYYEMANQDEEGCKKIKAKLNNPDWLQGIAKILPLPEAGDLRSFINDQKVAFLNPDDLPHSSLFVIKDLPNTEEGGIKNRQQCLYNEDINDALYNRFGLSVSYPSTNFSDLGGFDIPKKDILRTLDYVKKGYIQKNLSLFLGVSRSGKSFFAECLAGELNRRLIILDLGMIMCSPNPPRLLDQFFKYLETIDSYVLLIDEIEKAADPDSGVETAKVMIGKLLTIFNNFNSENGFQIKDNPVIATANNISNLLDKNPEFINRFGLKYFVNYPNQESFQSVFEYYLQKMKISGITGREALQYSNMIYAKLQVPILNRNMATRKYGKYASGEIKEFVANLMLLCEERDEGLYATVSILEATFELVKPQLDYANIGVNRTLEAARKANFIEVN